MTGKRLKESFCLLGRLLYIYLYIYLVEIARNRGSGVWQKQILHMN